MGVSNSNYIIFEGVQYKRVVDASCKMGDLLHITELCGDDVDLWRFTADGSTDPLIVGSLPDGYNYVEDYFDKFIRYRAY